MGARNGTTQSKGHAGSDAVPSHQVGLPMFRPVTAAAASAAVTNIHEMITMSTHALSRPALCCLGGCGTSVDIS